MSGRFRSRRWNFPSRVRYARGRYSGRRVGSSARRARGNMRAANQQNDISNVTINLMKKVKAGVTGFCKWENGESKKYDCGVCALNIFELLKKSEFYQSYSNMYDQFRVNRIQVKVTPVTWQTYNQFNLPYQTGANGAVGRDDANPAYPNNDADENEDVDGFNYQPPSLNNRAANNNYIVPQALTIVTAWDRTGLDDTQIADITVNIGDQQHPNNVNYKTVTIGDNITTYSSARSTQLVAGANFNCVRYLYPSSQQEKSLYFSTTDLVEQIQAPGVADRWYGFKPVANGYDSTKITNLHADPNCPFKPTFLIGVLKVDEIEPTAATNVAPGPTNPDLCKGQIYPVTFNLEFDIGVTFRGLRKTQVV
jgi:hypothetical protein